VAPPIAAEAEPTGTPRIVYSWVAICGVLTAVGMAVLVYIQR
jgi:hypothetical protein